MGRRLLVIDDSRLVVVMLTDGLEHEGYEVITASDGMDGLKKVEEQRPDLIILDVQMPTMTGYEFVDKLKEQQGEDIPPVIMLTADEVEDDMVNSPAVKACFQKPVPIAELTDKIKACLATEKD